MKQRFSQTIGYALLSVSLLARQRMLRLAVAMLFPVLLLSGQVTSAWGAPYHGQVVDAETGRPIEGAVVMVEWHKKPRVAMGGIAYFHNARETLTDAEGKFSLDSSPGVDWNPLTAVQEPRIAVFYPGYRPFSANEYPSEYRGLYEIAEAFERGVLVKLIKMKTEKELKYFTSQGTIGGIWAPFGTLPNLVRLINIQRKMAGIDELRYP
jgi:hypothetical protein